MDHVTEDLLAVLSIDRLDPPIVQSHLLTAAWSLRQMNGKILNRGTSPSTITIREGEGEGDKRK